MDQWDLYRSLKRDWIRASQSPKRYSKTKTDSRSRFNLHSELINSKYFNKNNRFNKKCISTEIKEKVQEM